MKRIDDLAGATVVKVEVGRGGKVRLSLNDTRGYSCEWSPIVIEIPPEPKKRKRVHRRPGAKR
jgi:hypothetical protein